MAWAQVGGRAERLGLSSCPVMQWQKVLVLYQPLTVVGYSPGITAVCPKDALSVFLHLCWVSKSANC